MPTQNVLTWKEGTGWLVLSGGVEPTGEIRGAVIERAAADGAVACLSLSGVTEGDEILNDMQDLGAPTGYIVDVLTEDDDTIRSRIGDASIVIISTRLDAVSVRSNIVGAVADGLTKAYERGAIILVEGTAITALGAYIPHELEMIDGLSWLEHGLILPGVNSIADSDVAQRVMKTQPDVIVVGIEVGSAIVFSGSGEVETWGQKKITLALGSAYTSH